MTEETAASVELRRLSTVYKRRSAGNPLAILAPLIPRIQHRRLLADVPDLRRTLAVAPGLWRPRAASHCFPDDSALVTINEGLIAFLRAVATALVSGSTMRFEGGMEPAPSRPADVNSALLALYDQWSALQREIRLDAAPVALPPRLAELVALQTRAAVFFFLMHEYAHVALHKDLDEDEHGPEEEVAADAWAVQQIIARSAAPRSDYRIMLSGALLAMRVLHALEVLGHSFPGNYPAPAERVHTVLQSFANLCPSPFSFYYYTTIAYATDQRMEAAERELKGLHHAPEPRCDTILATAMGALIEVHHGRIPLETAVREIAGMADAATPEVLAATGERAALVFTTEASPPLTSGEAESRAGVADAWRALLERLPDDHRRTLTSGPAS